MRWLLISVLIVSFFFSHTGYVQAQSWSDLDQKAEMALQLTKQGKYESAKNYLEQFSDQFLQMRFADESLEMEQLQVLSTSYQEARKALEAQEVSPEKRLQRVMQFRLAVDAVTSSHQPMWVELKPHISDTLQALKAASNDDKQGFESSYEQLQEMYTLIYPSLVMDRSKEDIQAVNATLQNLNQAMKENNNVSIEQVDTLEQHVMNLFLDEQETLSQTSFLWLSAYMGGMILLTLFYVAWRKYNGEKRNIHAG
ncbi:sporulation protein YpjB [Bacillus tianshenii]|nr:sporulation protein YpjB [Bacillus tianshenii]